MRVRQTLLRETFDEDWFRNPRVTADTVAIVRPQPAAPETSALVSWLVEQTRL
jgi:hypothetical protein